MVAPVVKWVGGKRQLLDELTPLFPNKFSTYCEPFVGGGAVLFNIQPSTAYINDANGELINVYEVIRDNVEELISSLQQHKNESEYFIKSEILIEIMRHSRNYLILNEHLECFFE